MSDLNAQELKKLFEEHFGFTPPCMISAAQLGTEMGEVMEKFHGLTWGEGEIPLKYRYLMALATAVYGDEDYRARMELLKALRCGATQAEIKETLQQQVWLRGAPVLVKIMPLLQFLEKITATQKVKDSTN
ncbi:carboxymuconolactone decarboxylase family protein [Azotosporobacter soli]|uniref:carboxymuconolactone decarboxylase family protein n=1 Tax=Azotosporobacter soli TaxID=3055040 RepID=UPI0031FEDDBC